MYNLVITMAGDGSRFTKEGYDTPKPFLKINDIPCFVWSLKGFDFQYVNTLIVITKSHFTKKYDIPNLVKKHLNFENTIVVTTKITTAGQACTALLAKEFYDNSFSLIIHNCDTYVQSPLTQKIKNLDKDGVLTVFEVAGDHWSFAKTDGGEKIIEVAEKVRISNWASTGTYAFKSGKVFIEYAEKMIKNNITTNKEFYISNVYKLMLDNNLNLFIDKADKVICYGTPIEYQNAIKENLMVNLGS